MTITLNGTTGITTPSIVADTDTLYVDATNNRVGVGTSSPTGKLQITGAGGVSGSSNLVYVDVSSSYGGITVNSSANNNSFVELLEAGTKVGGFNADTTNNVTSIQSAGGHALGFNYNNTTEAMRIDSSGNLVVSAGTSTPTTTTETSGFMGDGVYARPFYLNTALTSGKYCARFFVSGTEKGSIQVASGGTTYATTSDYRLKDNIAPMTNALSVVQQLKPVTYTWKADGSDGQGFIAHELQAVVPDCVTGEKDAVDEEGNPLYQGIDTSFLVATLTAAIQEQQAIITEQSLALQDLKARIETLENK